MSWWGPSHTVCSTRAVAAVAPSLRSSVVAVNFLAVTEVTIAVSVTETGARASSHTSCQTPAASCPHQEPAGWW